MLKHRKMTLAALCAVCGPYIPISFQVADCNQTQHNHPAMTHTGTGRSIGLAAHVAIAVLRMYKLLLSPLFHVLGARCRHGPTCSDYALEAFRQHGFWRGFWLTISPLSRCHPFGSHGWDPVPPKLPDHGWRFWRYGDWAWTERRAYPEVEIEKAGD